MKARMAFTARHWDQNAVVCCAQEHRAGASVMQEFGLFDSWTRANDFANKLNEGLGISELESRQIVTDSSIGFSEVLSTVRPSENIWNLAPVLRVAHVLRGRHVLARLRMALTFCSGARLLRRGDQKRRIVQSAQDAFDLALEILPRLGMQEAPFAEACGLLKELELHLRELSEGRAVGFFIAKN